MKHTINAWFVGFLCWWILLLPFEYHVFDVVFDTIRAPFYAFIHWLEPTLIFESDTYGMTVLMAFCFLMATIVTPIILLLSKRFQLNLSNLTHRILLGILVFFLVKYGWDKIVKQQFYLPEPNICYTPLGKLSKDIAFWSLLGSSHGFVVFLGAVECLTAIILLVRKTRFFGALLSVGIFTTIFIINCFFDISVKNLSFFLLFFSLILLFQFQNQLRSIFQMKQKPVGSAVAPNYRWLKWGIIAAVLLETTQPTIISGNWNDDERKRLLHTGAYRIHKSNQFIRLYIHSNGYFILENKQGDMRDFPIQQLSLNHYSSKNAQISIDWQNNTLHIQSEVYNIQLLPYRDLPLFENSFHVFSDQFH